MANVTPADVTEDVEKNIFSITQLGTTPTGLFVRNISLHANSYTTVDDKIARAFNNSSTPGKAMRKLKHTQAPIWIKLRHLPMEYWTMEGLSIVWMKDGDQCSKVFFRKIAQRRVTSRILQINDENGTTHTEQGEVALEFLSYYQNLLGGTRRCLPMDIRYLSLWARHIITDEEAAHLLLPFSPDDVKQAVFDIAEDNAPGPDGFSSGIL
ncbi:UNVERIFIED_CONTAM: hypothetical protein Sindi_1664600 [Sesamum indicum]